MERPVTDFKSWAAENAAVPMEDWTFRQYGNYVEGWRRSKPWAYKGMSVAYDWWAESKWNTVPDVKRLMDAWFKGALLSVVSRADTAEDCANWMLHDI